MRSPVTKSTSGHFCSASSRAAPNALGPATFVCDVVYFGNGSHTRQFTHVNDVAPVLAAAPLIPQLLGETFNIGSDEEAMAVFVPSEG